MDDIKNEIRKKEVYSYTKQTKKVVIEYNFWKTPYDTWKIMKTVYDVDDGNHTTEITIPEIVLNKMLIDSAKESLADE